MLSDEFPGMGARTLGGLPISLTVYVEDVPPDELEKRAAKAMQGMSSG